MLEGIASSILAMAICVIDAAVGVGQRSQAHFVGSFRSRNVTRKKSLVRCRSYSGGDRTRLYAKEQGMRIRSVLGLSLLFGLVACGGAAQNTKDHDGDVWVGYKGTYAGAKEKGSTSPAPTVEVPKKDTKAKTDTAEAADRGSAPDDTSDDSTAGEVAAAPLKKSKSTIGGESLSSIGEEELAAQATKSLKSDMLSSSIMVGAKYERVQVQLKGATVSIIRPAANPNAKGPAVADPKTRKTDLAQTETAYYDADADVLVVVSAPKKAAAQKALGSIVKK
jgi:hypothetical protein